MWHAGHLVYPPVQDNYRGTRRCFPPVAHEFLSVQVWACPSILQLAICQFEREDLVAQERDRGIRAGCRSKGIFMVVFGDEGAHVVSKLLVCSPESLAFAELDVLNRGAKHTNK